MAWLLLAALTAWLGWRSYTLSTSGSVADGTVVRLLEDGPAFDADFYPVVEFQVDGKTYEVQSQNNYRWWNRYTRFPVGGQVDVRYETANPENAEINSWWDVWNETILLGGFTILAAVVINVYLLFRWRSQRAAAVHAANARSAWRSIPKGASGRVGGTFKLLQNATQGELRDFPHPSFPKLFSQ